MSRLYDPVAIARQFLYVREAGANTGQRVNGIQMWSGGQEALGTSWCAWFATFALDIAYGGTCPLPREGSCEAIHQLATVKGWIADEPEPGDLVLSINSAGVAHHIGIVSQVSPLTSVAGNTSADGTSSNGDRVAEHVIDSQYKTFVRVPQ